LLLLSLSCLAIAVGCGERSASPGDAATTEAVQAETGPAAPAASQVTIDNFTYAPATLAVAVGTKVTWTNHDDVPHTVTSTTRPRPLDSPTLDTDDSFAHVFTMPGTYEYYCAVHPKMTARVIVK
jgi:plastocyanin